MSICSRCGKNYAGRKGYSIMTLYETNKLTPIKNEKYFSNGRGQIKEPRFDFCSKKCAVCYIFEMNIENTSHTATIK